VPNHKHSVVAEVEGLFGLDVELAPFLTPLLAVADGLLVTPIHRLEPDGDKLAGRELLEIRVVIQQKSREVSAVISLEALLNCATGPSRICARALLAAALPT
jgi:hypothetical protein